MTSVVAPTSGIVAEDRPVGAEGRSESDEVTMLRDALATHRSMLLGALSSNRELDIDNAFAAHAGLSRMLAFWDDHTAGEQRKIISAVEYVINASDERDDLHDVQGFADDLAYVTALQRELGYR